MIAFFRSLATAFIYALCITGCNFEHNGTWIDTSPSNIKVWLSDFDSLSTYQWEGSTFDSVAHGMGILTISQGGEVTQRIEVQAVYGAIQDNEIVSVANDEKYIGKTINDLFDGYGVYIKGGDIYIGNFINGLPNGYLTLYKNNKVYYKGYWDSGKFHGEGTLYKEDGNIKAGEWEYGALNQTLTEQNLAQGHYKGYIKNSQPDGVGIITYNDSSSFQGGWKNGSYHGTGLLCYGNDSIFGNWENGKLTGDILYKTPNFIYEGGFVDNTPTGIGGLTFRDGSIYSGTFVDGKRNGTGDMLFPNGDSYFGDWENNDFNGIGTFTYQNQKSLYEGEWQNGLQHGVGRYKSPKLTYSGEWDNGWMDGDGRFYFPNGDKYEGTIHQNKIDGIGCYEFANGNCYEGEFVDGQITGNGVFQFKDGNRFEGEFYNGRVFGDGTMLLKTKKGVVAITGFWPSNGKFPNEASMLFENGDLYEGALSNGQPSSNGTWVSGKDRIKNIEAVENSPLNKANELYKKHRETINTVLIGASAVVTAIEIGCASSAVGTPIAVIAHGINTGINFIDASAAIASAGVDVYNNVRLGEDHTETSKHLATEVALNAAMILVPKVIEKAIKPLKTSLKGVSRSSAAIVGKSRLIIKKSAIKFIKGRLHNRVYKVTVKIEQGVRKVERTLVRSKTTQDLMLATGRLFTRFKHQAIPYSSYLSKIKKNPKILEKLNLVGDGNSKVLENNMNLLGLDKWVHKNERIKRYLGIKRQVEAHHIIPSNPVTESSRQAQKIWVKYFGSVNHPCNGIWLGRYNKNIGYKGLAKGSNHSPNTKEYEEFVGNLITQTYSKHKKHTNNPELMQKFLAEAVDELKYKLYRGELAIGAESHQVHTTLGVFRDKASVVRDASSSFVTSLQRAINR